MSESVKEPLRCWAMLPALEIRPELYCMLDVSHDDALGGCCADDDGRIVFWKAEECACDHGPIGRRSVAHRILELSWRAELIDFRLGKESNLSGALRDIAARLYQNTSSAQDDSRALIVRINAGREMSVQSPSMALTKKLQIIHTTLVLLQPMTANCWGKR